MVEGKLKIWIKGGKFKFKNDLYVKVLCDTSEVWKTDESDSSTPSRESTCTTYVNGVYEKLIFQLMDEDTFSRDNLLGSCEIKFSTLETHAVVGEMEMTDEDCQTIGTIDLSVEFEAGKVISVFNPNTSRNDNSDSD